MSSRWKKETIDQLIVLWKEGYTAKEIAQKLNIESRNAVIGKLHRIRKQYEQKNIQTTISQRKTLTKATYHYIFQNSKLIKHDTCRWPIGNPKSPVFYFCQKDKAPNSIYCTKHSKNLNRKSHTHSTHRPTH